MRITGLTAPEYSMLLWTSLILLAVIVTLIVRAVRSHRTLADQKLHASAAYQRLAQLDDLRERGALTEEESAEKKQQIMGDL